MGDCGGSSPEGTTGSQEAHLRTPDGLEGFRNTHWDRPLEVRATVREDWAGATEGLP